QPVNTAPVVTISTPTSGSSFNSGSSISFTGSATDTQDGIRTASLVWTSSIDGQIGTGGSFSKSSLSAGTHTIIATATDTAGATGQASISLTVTASSTGGTASFSSATAITIPGMGAATPYASTINVSGMSGSISQVTVKLNGFSHTYPDDVDVVLVSPTGQKVVLMSDAGGGTAINNVTLTFSDSASVLPDSGQIVSGTFKPTDFVSGDTFPAPAPAGPYATSLSAFNGQSPNGTWSLYVVDDAANDQGSIAGGWSLTVTTGQSTTNPPPATLSVAVTTDRTSYVNGNRVNFTARVTGGTNPVSGAATALTLLTASGRQVSFTGTTDGNGYFKSQYKISSSRDGIGTYRATVTSSTSGYTSGSGTATFTVTR